MVIKKVFVDNQATKKNKIACIVLVMQANNFNLTDSLPVLAFKG